MVYPTSTMPPDRRSLALPDLLSIDVSRLRSIRLLGVAVVGLSGIAVLLLVRLTGGTPNPLNHLGYLPVLLSAFIFGLRGGVVGAIYVGILLGPLPPALGLVGAHGDLLGVECEDVGRHEDGVGVEPGVHARVGVPARGGVMRATNESPGAIVGARRSPMPLQ